MTAVAKHTYRHAFGDEPLPGYRLVSPLGQGGFGEVWKCHAPGGLHKAIKFVREDPDRRPDRPDGLDQEYEAFQRVKGIRHPFLLTLERVELIGGELIQVMELADQSLGQRYEACRTAGKAGIPRDELLAYMVDAAEALDVLARDHGLQHLDVKPANLFVVGGHVKVGDYGLVSRHVSATAAGDRRLNQGYTPRYVSPEVLDGRVHRCTDQYPLALIYQELLTGRFPYPGPSSRHLVVQHKTAAPDLSPLPPSDHPAVARALAKNPADRFPTCLEFVKALIRDEPPPATLPPRGSTAVTAHAAQRRVPPTGGSGVISTRSTTIPSDAFATMRMGPAALDSLSGRLTLQARVPDDLARTCPGFQQVAELDFGPRGRRLRAKDATGQPVQVHLLRLDGGVTAELEAVATSLADLHHPHLWQSVSAPHPRAVGIITPDGTPSLAEWLKARREQNKGVTAREAVTVLEPAAEALDELHARPGFPHALVSDATILVSEGRGGITGYGVAELLRLSSADAEWARHDPFVASETAAGTPHPAGDQYSLALVFLELIGAWAPPPKGERSLERIQWNRLAESVRRAVRTALSPDPTRRFESCREFLAAVRPSSTDGVVLDDIRLVESVPRLNGAPGGATPLPPPDAVVEVVLRAATAMSGQPDSGGKPRTLPDGRVAIRFPVRWTPGLGELKTNAFKDQFRFLVIQLAPDTTLLKPVSILGVKSEPIELVVQWPVGSKAAIVEVSATGRWTGGMDPFRGVPLVTAMLEQFRRLVQNSDDRRKAPRVRADLAVEVYPVGDDLQVGGAMGGRCRDVSATGFGAVFPVGVGCTHAFVRFPEVAGADGHAVLAKVVRETPATGSAPAVSGWRFVHAGDGR